MDNMTIESKFLSKMVSKIITKEVSKKVGFDIEVLINSINIRMDGEKARIGLNAVARTDQKNVEALLDKYSG